MEKILQNTINKVDNPIYMSKEDIEKNYWGNQVVLTNIEYTPKGEPFTWVGGKVQYYAKYLKGLHKVLIDATRTSNDLGECGIMYIGDMGYILL